MSNTCSKKALQLNSFADPGLPLAVIVARTKWNEPPRMRHQLTHQLLRRFNVLFVELFHERQLAPREDGFRRESDRLLVFSPGEPFFVPQRLYTNDPLTHHAVNQYLRQKIGLFVEALTPKFCLLVNFVHDFPEIMQNEQFDFRIYVCYDEFPKMWRRARQPNRLKYAYHSWLGQCYENLVAQRADRVLATHTPLADKLRSINPRTALYLHGHEPQGLVCQGMARAEKETKIRVGFMGYITYNLLLDWLVALLTTEEMILTLIGPIRKFDMAPFSLYKNFHHIPALTGASLAEALASNDVLVMPYNPAIPEVHVQTASNKFFQYLAASRPVVISDMPYYLQMPAGVLYRARTVGEFVAQVRQAYREDCDEFVQTRQKIASENTWDKRGDQLFALLEQDNPALCCLEKAGR
jgi:hypothetical protein